MFPLFSRACALPLKPAPLETYRHWADSFWAHLSGGWESITALGTKRSCFQRLVFLPSFSDPGAGSWVPGLHGSVGFWTQTGPDHYAEARGYSGSAEEADEGMSEKGLDWCKGERCGAVNFPAKALVTEAVWYESHRAPKNKQLGSNVYGKMVEHILRILPAVTSESL